MRPSSSINKARPEGVAFRSRKKSKEDADPIWTRTFILLCIFQMLGYAQHFMLIPILPLYIEKLGGTPLTVGTVIAMFGFAGIFTRPVMGRLSDIYGEVRVMLGGVIIKGVGAVLFTIPSIPFAGFVNGIRGVGWGGFNVAGYSLVALVTPKDRTGEANGIYRGVQLGANVVFPAFALWLLDNSSENFKFVFFAVAILALIGTAVGMYMDRTLPRVKQSQMLERSRFVDPVIRLPLFLHVLLHLSQNSVGAFAVLYAKELGLANIGWLFVACGTTTLIAQPGLGKLSDKYAKWKTTASAFVLHIVAFYLFAKAVNLSGLVAGGMFYMFGLAIGATSTHTLATDRAKKDEQRRGQIMGGFAIGYPLSSLLGGFLIGSAVNWLGYRSMYSLLIAVSAVGLIITVAKRETLK